jgi:hypothetical protein
MRHDCGLRLGCSLGGSVRVRRRVGLGTASEALTARAQGPGLAGSQ